MTSRQTDAAWRYDYLRQYAAQREIQGSEQAVTALVPDPDLLIAIKLHGGRLADVRDVVALAADADLAAVEQYLIRGDEAELQTILDDALETLRDEDFVDAFTGVFQQQELPAETINRVTAVLEEQRNTLADRGET